jgi:hypothetical protein
MADTFGNSHNQSPPPSGASTEFERSIARTMDHEHEPDAAPGLREKISEDVAGIKQAAEQAAHNATDKAAEMAEQQKSYAAAQIEKFATALEKVGGELQSQQAGAIGDYTSQLGTSARRFSEKVKDKDLGQIAGIAGDFGRRQPLAFLGLAAIAGLAASRFMMASTSDTTSGSSPNTAQANTTENYNG